MSEAYPLIAGSQIYLVWNEIHIILSIINENSMFHGVLPFQS